MRSLAPCAAALLLLVCPAAATAQTIDVRPLLLLEEDPVPGIRITTLHAQTRVLIGPYPKNWYWDAFADAPLFTKADRNPETLRAQIDAGVQISLFRPSLPPPGQPPSPEDPPPWNYGFMALQLGVGAEAPQSVRTADVTLGASLAYEHDQYHELWFLPELRIAYDAVFCIDCNDAVTFDGSGDTGWRANGDIGWSIPADHPWVPSLLKPLWLRLNGRAFHGSGLEDVEPMRNEEGLWGSAELAYRCDRCGPVHEVYVRGNGGRLPQRLREKRAFTAGVSLAF